MNLLDIVKNIHSLGDRAQEWQRALNAMSVEGEAAAGAVRLTLDGNNRITELIIAPSLLSAQNPTIVSDLVKAAHADALQKIDQKRRESILKTFQDLPIPPGLDSMLFR